MDRKNFLIQLWKKFFKPVLILAVAYYCIKFLVAIINENGAERQITVFIVAFIILYTFAYLIGELFSRTRERVLAKLSENVRFKLRIIRKVCEYLAILMLGALLYKLWMENAIFASILIILFLIDRIYSALKEENVKT